MHGIIIWVRKRGPAGHGELQIELEWVPRMVQAMVGTRVVDVDAGGDYVVVLTEAGGVLAFRNGDSGRPGHSTDTKELVPQAAEALAGKPVTLLFDFPCQFLGHVFLCTFSCVIAGRACPLRIAMRRETVCMG